MWNSDYKHGKVNCESSFPTLINMLYLGGTEMVTYLSVKLSDLHQKWTFHKSTLRQDKG